MPVGGVCGQHAGNNSSITHGCHISMSLPKRGPSFGPGPALDLEPALALELEPALALGALALELEPALALGATIALGPALEPALVPAESAGPGRPAALREAPLLDFISRFANEGFLTSLLSFFALAFVLAFAFLAWVSI